MAAVANASDVTGKKFLSINSKRARVNRLAGSGMKAIAMLLLAVIGHAGEHDDSESRGPAIAPDVRGVNLRNGASEHRRCEARECDTQPPVERLLVEFDRVDGNGMLEVAFKHGLHFGREGAVGNERRHLEIKPE